MYYYPESIWRIILKLHPLNEMRLSRLQHVQRVYGEDAYLVIVINHQSPRLVFCQVYSSDSWERILHRRERMPLIFKNFHFMPVTLLQTAAGGVFVFEGMFRKLLLRRGKRKRR